mmetsp:Transcript_92249/g.166630  ORF Transcript_92249/g.166630 Transcript_92249/m.166630 type:complete len:212 (+) Transcript_92249:590-1225(+)
MCLNHTPLSVPRPVWSRMSCTTFPYSSEAGSTTWKTVSVSSAPIGSHLNQSSFGYWTWFCAADCSSALRSRWFCHASNCLSASLTSPMVRRTMVELPMSMSTVTPTRPLRDRKSWNVATAASKVSSASSLMVNGADTFSAACRSCRRVCSACCAAGAKAVRLRMMVMSTSGTCEKTLLAVDVTPESCRASSSAAMSSAALAWPCAAYWASH